ncbi:hypothetical protein DR864_27290 [Runella rosea]|uniref:Uncharacterized protein n=1 Tax=Runella rosea TaxID=2259595 RepID=A0A344TRA7_9BACT|nr:hypothetical protein [Runella rosea]AXE21178.1 hypothetical protein DR864_27290 [Runella rosea]
MTTINLIPVVMPAVVSLNIRTTGAPFSKEVAPETKMIFQEIFYELRDANGRVRESGLAPIPFSVYAKISEFVAGQVSEETLAFVNQFFQQAGWDNLTAINPPIENGEQ